MPDESRCLCRRLRKARPRSRERRCHREPTQPCILTLLTIAVAALYLLWGVDFDRPALASYALRIRLPKAAAMLVATFAIGAASIVFQSIINNTIVTPRLLGMNSLYTLIHTAVFFFAGSGSLLATNDNLAFVVDLVIMASRPRSFTATSSKRPTTTCSTCCSLARC